MVTTRVDCKTGPSALARGQLPHHATALVIDPVGTELRTVVFSWAWRRGGVAHRPRLNSQVGGYVCLHPNSIHGLSMCLGRKLVRLPT